MFKKGLFLVVSGFLGALGMLLLTSGQIFALDATLINATMIFIAWQTLGVTVSKLGTDQVVFATCISKAQQIDVLSFLGNRVIPIAIMFCVVAAIKYPVAVVLLMFISIVLDVASILFLAKANAELDVKKVFIASVLNYPTFLILLYLLTLVFHVDSLTIVALCFVSSSLVRILYLMFTQEIRGTGQIGTATCVEANFALGAFQGINYWLFRGGQIAAGLPLFSSDSRGLSTILFFWTVIDVIDRFNLALTPVLYRKLLEGTRSSNVTIIGMMSLLPSAAFVLLAWGVTSLLQLDIDDACIAVLGLNALLLFLPNYLNFRLVRQQRYQTLIKYGATASIMATLLTVLLYIQGAGLVALVAYVPISLLLLCIINFTVESKTLERLRNESPATDTV